MSPRGIGLVDITPGFAGYTGFTVARGMQKNSPGLSVSTDERRAVFHDATRKGSGNLREVGLQYFRMLALPLL